MESFRRSGELTRGSGRPSFLILLALTVIAYAPTVLLWVALGEDSAFGWVLSTALRYVVVAPFLVLVQTVTYLRPVERVRS